ncbi:adhesion G protein-coupled receptor E3-like isoform X1 [Chrysemys picta bellii]|uniref:adhesion G protein-coupled receptor E3-like isoform X1 n=2 Tax=Chrysemys picta bellii TaxID=8478 RepID=UPI0003890D1A
MSPCVVYCHILDFKQVLFIFSQVFFLLGLFWFLPPASAQRTNTTGTCQTETLGREFITSYMDDCGNSSQFEVQITGYFAFTSVSVSISNYQFDKKIMVNWGEMVRVSLPESVGIKGTTNFSNVVLVKADKDISVVSVSNKHVSPETTVLYPVSSLGNEHYIVTPSTESLDSYPEFSVMTYQEPNSVEVHVKGKLHYLIQDNSTGSRLTIKLHAFQGIQFQGIGDLSGTRIVSEKPVAILVGQRCFCNNTKCNHVFEQLLPVCSWGTKYIVPPLPWQKVDEIVYITASRNTTVLYQLGEQAETVTLAGGSVLQRPVKPWIPVYISANVGIQVVFYSVGAPLPNSSHAFLMNVPDVASYCQMYSINAQEGFENFALMVANTAETGAIILDNQPVRDVVWNRVPGTEFVWGMRTLVPANRSHAVEHPLVPANRSHAVEHPSSPFALLSVGTAAMDSYGIPGSCRKNVTFKCQTETPQIQKQLEMCKDVFLKGNNSEFCSFVNLTIVNLETMCAQDRAVSLEDFAGPFGPFLNSSTLSAGGNENKREVASAVTFLLQSVELAALTAALKSPEMKTQNVTTESMAIETLLVVPAAGPCDEVFRLRALNETMDIHCDTVTKAATEDSWAVAFISYFTLDSIIDKRFLKEGDLMADEKLRNCHLNSRVVSGAVGDGRLMNLSKPVNFTLRHRQAKKEEEEALCVHWKFIAGRGFWAEDGCTVLHTNSTHTICSCDHLSSFALLMGHTEVEESYPLTIVTYVGLTLSLLCLLLAILTFLLCRSIRNISTSIHLQLCLCLFLANLLFLTAVTRTSIQVVCAVIAGFLHYLFLACFTWMFLEGLHLFLTVRNLKVVNYTSTSWFKKRFMYPFGYGFPALVVVISAALNPDGYGTSKHCWLSLDRGFRWSFLGPVCAIILINLTFFLVTLWILRDKLSSLNEDVSTLKDTRLLTFKAIAQLFILGCTWSLGLFQVSSAKMVMAYLFTIVNSLQGVFIFLVHCLLNRQVREEYRRWIKGTRKSSPPTQTFSLSRSTVTTSTKMAPCITGCGMGWEGADGPSPTKS